MQVDVGLGIRRLGGALGGGLAVGGREVVVCFEQGGALRRRKGDGLLDEVVQGGGFLWRFVSYPTLQ